MGAQVRPRSLSIWGGAALLALAVTGCNPGSTEPETSQTEGRPPSMRAKDIFDLQAHRGGRGEFTESSWPAYEHAIELGVTTLELDIVLTSDGVPVVWHDFALEPAKCRDTDPVDENEPAFPYVGAQINSLTWEQLATVKCDQPLAEFPDQEIAQGNRLLQLRELFERAAVAEDIRFNIETKIDADDPEASAGPEEIVNAILGEVDRAGVADRVTVQSFDWRTLEIVDDLRPQIPLVMLWSGRTWVPGSAWTGSVDYDEVSGDVIEAAEYLNISVLSPKYSGPWQTRPEPGSITPVLMAPAEFITRAHAKDLRVVPWTVNDEETMNELIDAGVDGMITDYPSRLAALLDAHGVPYGP